MKEAYSKALKDVKSKVKLPKVKLPKEKKDKRKNKPIMAKGEKS